jgi:hypothetical protein
MHTLNVRNKLNLYRKKIGIVFFALFLLCIGQFSYAQRSLDINLPDYEKRRIQYGFFFGIHSSSFRLKYSEEFTSSSMANVHSIVPMNNGGLSIGFHGNVHLFQFLDFRVMPKFAYYEQSIVYNYLGRQSHTEVVEAWHAELPLLFKYKSERRKNSRMYVLAGIAPSFEATGKQDVESSTPRLLTNRYNVALEYGRGLDVFFPLFKFSPELRFSHGLVNMLSSNPNEFSRGIDRLTTHSVSFYILFEGGR